MPVVIGALVVGLAGLGVGIYAVVKIPAMTSGPTGAAGTTGKQGVQGAGTRRAPGSCRSSRNHQRHLDRRCQHPQLGT